MSILPAEDDDARCGLFGQPAIVSGLIVADQRFVIHATEFLEIGVPAAVRQFFAANDPLDGHLGNKGLQIGRDAGVFGGFICCEGRC